MADEFLPLELHGISLVAMGRITTFFLAMRDFGPGAYFTRLAVTLPAVKLEPSAANFKSGTGSSEKKVLADRG